MGPATVENGPASEAPYGVADRVPSEDGVYGDRPSHAGRPSHPSRADRDVAAHTWDDIAPILAHARRAGATVVLTETGRRPDDPRMADLCFTVTREAVTNAMRHARGLGRIVVSWDHADDATTVTVRDDGPDGTGLGRLRARVGAAGGVFRAGPDEDGWTVYARVPASGGAPRSGIGEAR